MTAAWRLPPEGSAAEQAARFASLVPVIDTARLRLRAPRIEDFPIYARFMLDEAVADDGADEKHKAAWLEFNALVASWNLRGFGAWTCDTRSDRTPVGAVVINHEFGDPEVEIGWVLTPDAEGRGYATEAAAQALNYAFGPMGFATLVSYIDADNDRSSAVARRLGARRDPGAEAALNHACHVYRHVRPEVSA